MKKETFIIIILIITFIKGCQYLEKEFHLPSKPNNTVYISEVDVSKGVDRVKNQNKFYNLVISLHPEIEQELSKVLKQKFGNKTVDIETVNLDGLLDEMPIFNDILFHYLIKAPDEEFFHSFYVEYDHMKKNGCKATIPSTEDAKETAEAKYNLVVAARERPYTFKPVSDKEMERIMTKVIKNYAKKGYDIENLQAYFTDGGRYLSDFERCQTQIHFFESLLSLPKKESVIILRHTLSGN